MIDMERVHLMNLSLYKRFGYPEKKELGIDLFETGYEEESEGEVYVVDINNLPDVLDRQNPLPKGKSLFLFNKPDIKKLHHNVDAVELIITKENTLLIILHYLYDGRLYQEQE